MDDSKCDLMDIFRNAWLEVVEASTEQLIVEVNGVRSPITRQFPFFLAALPPEPAKDPFAVGAWVVCVEDDPPLRADDICRVSDRHGSDPDSWFTICLEAGVKWGMQKSNFRPATPGEIAAHLEKTARADQEPITSEDCELKITPAVPLDADAKGDGKITFTVCGREFFVGQRVWVNTSGGIVEAGDEVEAIGVHPKDLNYGFMARKVGTWQTCILCPDVVDFTPPRRHEWQFGDQASHPDHGTVLVIDVTELESFQCASPSDPDIFIDPAELTFIRRTDLGE